MNKTITIEAPEGFEFDDVGQQPTQPSIGDYFTDGFSGPVKCQATTGNRYFILKPIHKYEEGKLYQFSNDADFADVKTGYLDSVDYDNKGNPFYSSPQYYKYCRPIPEEAIGK